jgi:hypothetical protein
MRQSMPEINEIAAARAIEIVNGFIKICPLRHPD